jgi:hypothetical protein
MVGILLLDWSRLKLLFNDTDLMQARYNAEAGIYTILDSLKQNKNLKQGYYNITLPWGDKCEINLEYFGGFVKLFSEGYSHKKKFTIQTYAGEVPRSDYQSAVLLPDSNTPLTLAGTSNITGNVITGISGIRTNPFHGTQYAGVFNGSNIIRKQLSLPEYNTGLYTMTINQFNSFICSPPSQAIVLNKSVLPSTVIQPEKHESLFFFSKESIVLNNKTPKYEQPIYVVSQRKITISEEYSYPDGSVFIGQERISLSDNVSGNFGIFYSPKTIFVSDDVNCSAQFISGDSLVIMDRTKLEYPSVLYLIGRESDDRRFGIIDLQDSSYVGGTLIYPPSNSVNIRDNGIIQISEKSSVNGVVYCSNKLSLQGTIYGTAITKQFYD